MFFDSWFDLLRILVVGTLAYAGLIALIRLAGKRSLAKLNAFDLIVTVALGSTLATVLLSTDVALAEGLLAFALLLGLQYLVSFASVRSDRFEAIVKAEPAMLLHRGRFLSGPMRRERITREEILSQLRAEGYSDPSDVEAVILETDGSISTIGPKADPDGTAIPVQKDATRDPSA